MLGNSFIINEENCEVIVKYSQVAKAQWKTGECPELPETLPQEVPSSWRGIPVQEASPKLPGQPLPLTLHMVSVMLRH